MGLMSVALMLMADAMRRFIRVKSKHIDFTLEQPATTLWSHAHPCPSTAEQVWHGLAAMVIVKDDHEASLAIAKELWR